MRSPVTKPKMFRPRRKPKPKPKPDFYYRRKAVYIMHADPLRMVYTYSDGSERSFYDVLARGE